MDLTSLFSTPNWFGPNVRPTIVKKWLQAVRSSTKSLHVQSRAGIPKSVLRIDSTALLAAAAVLLAVALWSPRDSLAVGNPAPAWGPGFDWWVSSAPSSVEVGESFDMRFRIRNVTHTSDHGGISVSFPDLTLTGAGSSSYSSRQGSVEATDYTTGTSNVSYYDRGDLLWTSHDGREAADYLLVETDDSSWPQNVVRTLELEITPRQVGTFRVHYRFWICSDGYEDCSRRPSSRSADGYDQQGFETGSISIRVEEPREEAPEFDWRAWDPPSRVEIGESFRLKFRLDDLSGPAEDGSISVSFPDLTLSGGDSTHYSSAKGSVRTVGYSSGTSRVVYYDRGRSIWDSSDSQVSADYLLVEPNDPNWPADSSRTLELEVTPQEAGVFRVYFRFWLCVDNYSDCSRAPTGQDVDNTDQQGFHVGAFSIRVDEPSQPNRPPSASIVSPSQSQTLRVGDQMTFVAAATDPDANLTGVRWYVDGIHRYSQAQSPRYSVERTYTYTFSTGGAIRIEARFYDAESDSHSVYWDVSVGQSPIVSNLGCSATRVQVGETVGCNPSLEGGIPTSYLWGSVDGSPWAGTDRTFSTHWDTPGRKQIAFEACNDDGCDDGKHAVTVEPQVNPPPRIDRLDCSSASVKARETVSCRARLSDSDGRPSRYQWRSQGGSPSSGNTSSFSTHWDSPGTKQISLEVCNYGGCDAGQHVVAVMPDLPATLIVTATDQIVPGASIDITGSGFRRDYTVDSLSFGDRAVLLQWNLSTDGTGGFTVRVTVPSLPPGTYDVVAEVDSELARTSIRIEVPPQPNRAPTVSHISPLTTIQLVVGTRQVFTAEAWDQDSNLSKVEWFVNGRLQNSEPLNSIGLARKSLTYAVSSVGSFRLTVTFTDSEGASDAVEWRFQGIVSTPPRVLALDCSPFTVSVEETVTCNPRLSGGDATEYAWSANAGVPSSGSQESFSTGWSSAGQREIELEICNSGGACDSRSQAITVEDAIYIGAQETFHGRLSFTGDQQLLKVFVSAGRRLRLELTEPLGADFDFSVGFAGIEEEVSRSWELNLSGTPESIEIHPTPAGWYTIRVFSKGGYGAYEFLTRTDQAYLDLVLDRGNFDNVDLRSILLRKLNCSGASQSISRRTLVDRNEDTETYRFNFEDSPVSEHPDCMFDFTDGNRWEILFSFHFDRSNWGRSNWDFWNIFNIYKYYDWLDSATIYLTYDDVHWFDSSDKVRLLAGTVGYLCIPSCGPLSEEEIYHGIMDFLYLDDIETSSSSERAVSEKLAAAVFLGLNWLPLGESANLSKLLRIRPKGASKSYQATLNWIRRTNIDDVDPSLRTIWKRLETYASVRAVGERLPKLTTKSMDELLTPSEFAKVSNTRIDGKSAGDAWVVIKSKLGNGQELTRNELGLYRELQVAAAAKQLDMTLPQRWLRSPAGRPGRFTTDLDILARLPTGELIVFESKGNWTQFVSKFEPKGNWPRFVSSEEAFRLAKLKGHLALLLLEAKREGAEALVIVASGLPEKKLRVWMAEQGIIYLQVAR